MAPFTDLCVSLSEALAARGLPVHGFVGGAELREYLGRVPAALRDAWALDTMRGALVAALPYDPRPLCPPSASRASMQPATRLGSIAAFAAQHHYAALSRMLKASVASLCPASGFFRKDFRIAVNSPLPEKALAVLAGLAFIGRSSLAISRDYGPACVLGAIFLPFDPMVADDIEARSSAGSLSAALDSGAFKPGALCGACRACVDACPGGAIAVPGSAYPGLNRGLCIQHWAADGKAWSGPQDLPPAVAAGWGARFYGCDECIRACPYSKGAFEPLRDGASPASLAAALVLEKEAIPGPCVDLDYLVAADEEALRRWRAGSALGFSWFGSAAVKRNARMALLSYLEPFGI